ncbi:MAG: LamG-like jellyroll fold domain-containing protein [Pseudomonadota bacterium]
MLSFRKSLTGGALALALAACSGSPDEPVITENGYAIDILRLDGTDSLVFDPDEAIAPADQATIEFWVQVGWDEDPGFDPVVLANSGPEGSAYVVAIEREGDGLILASGEQIDIAPFDFNDGELHHVALIDYGATTVLRVDQTVIAELNVDLVAYPSQGLYFGTERGEEDGFRGVIGGFRLWDVAVDAGNLAAFAKADVLDEENPHPDLESLSVISDFAAERVVYIEQ